MVFFGNDGYGYYWHSVMEIYISLLLGVHFNATFPPLNLEHMHF